jgi:hypothetical protein
MTEKKTQVIDAEFVDVDGKVKGGKRVLERVADLADHAAEPLTKVGADAYAAKAKQVASVTRDVDGLIEEAKPIVDKVGSTWTKVVQVMGLNEDREVLRR